MTQKELQGKIDREYLTAKDMRQIGEAYLRGDVIRDKVAAEGWLTRAVEQEEPLESAFAMALIAREILGKEKVLSDEDYRDIQKELESEKGDKKEELEALLFFATAEQRKGLPKFTEGDKKSNGGVAEMKNGAWETEELE